MDADTRRGMKALIDRAVRDRVQAFVDADELVLCSGCGGEIDSHTPGCVRCWDRMRSRKRRALGYVPPSARKLVSSVNDLPPWTAPAVPQIAVARNGLTPVTDELAYLLDQQAKDAKFGWRVFGISLDVLVEGGVIDPPANGTQPWDDDATVVGRGRIRLRSGYKRKVPQHGTVGMYSNQGCRCGACRAAVADAQRELRRKRGAKPRTPPQHGTVSGYTKLGCRCDLCRQAQRDAARKRRAAFSPAEWVRRKKT